MFTTLKDAHTRQLMKMRAYLLTGDIAHPGSGELTQLEMTADRFGYKQVLAELATREHVPNKVEAKRIRQQKAGTTKRKRNNHTRPHRVTR